MSKTCVICKTNPATTTVRIADKNTGAWSNPVPLCENCLNRVSQTRQVETIPDSSDKQPESLPSTPRTEPESAPINEESKTRYKATTIISIIVIITGIACIIAALCLKVPGSHLRTKSYSYGSLDYGITLKDDYSLIEEYVGGDAYNYIIGASLVGGYISGMIAQRTIFIVAGVILILAGAFSLCVIADKKK